MYKQYSALYCLQDTDCSILYKLQRKKRKIIKTNTNIVYNITFPSLGPNPRFTHFNCYKTET